MTRIILAALAALMVLAAPVASAQQPAQAQQGRYQNFRAAIYVVVGSTRRLADPAVFEREFDRVSRQVRFDKVYLEVYRNRDFAADAEIDAVKRMFEARGVQVSGGVTLAAGGQGGQFGTFDYEDPADRAECRRAVEIAARHFDEVILDDFFFYTSKSDADIRARGRRSWTQYRLDTMREASQSCVIRPARAINPDIRLIIKYPNWYEHFQGLGYDLERQPHMFDGIYTGTETRDPIITDQLLQQYESYLIFRYFDNIRPRTSDGRGGNLGGWVDTFATRYVDRYAEQLWLTMFARAPEITLFSWAGLAAPRAVAPGSRDAWRNLPTSFDWAAFQRSYRPGAAADDPGAGWARAAGYALEQVDRFLGRLGRPVGIAAYKPYHSTGEDFLHNYLGNVGVPLDLHPTFPADAQTILLAESAKFDPDIVARIDAALRAGRNVIITSGLLRALQGRGIESIVEVEATGRTAAIRDFIDGFGAGAGRSLNDPDVQNPAILFPEIRFFTNDSWPIIRGVAGARGFPIVLMNRYSRGIIFVLTIPENIGDLYNLPRGVLTRIKAYLMADFPVRIESDPLVSLFVYDNDTLIVQSFRDAPSEATILVAGENKRLVNILTDAQVPAPPPSPPPAGGPAGVRRDQGPPRTRFTVRIEPHSYLVFRVQ